MFENLTLLDLFTQEIFFTILRVGLDLWLWRAYGLAFLDILALLFERAKKEHGVKTEQDFAERHGMTRPHMIQFLKGHKVPPPNTMQRILFNEGYELSECIYLPDVDANMAKRHQRLFSELQEVLEQEEEPVVIATVTGAIHLWYQQKREREKPE